MAEPDYPLLDDLKHSVEALAADLRELAALHVRLAQSELNAATQQFRWFAVVLAAAGGVVVVAVSLLAFCLVELLQERLGGARTVWLAGIGLGALVASLAAAWLAWRRFRRRFVGLQQTAAELRENVVWIEEWLGKKDEG